MIGALRGRLIAKGRDWVMIDTGTAAGGVGYTVTCAERTVATLPAIGQPVMLYTAMLVREDLLQLLGFPSVLEKELYGVLTSVQGVGAKAALALLGGLGPDALRRAIAMGDVSAIRRAQGVGPKLAQRIVNELKGKAAEMMALGGEAPPPPPMPEDGAVIDPAPPVPPVGLAQAAPATASADALSALMNLGYPAETAAQAIAEATSDAPAEGDATAGLIRAALRRLSSEVSGHG